MCDCFKNTDLITKTNFVLYLKSINDEVNTLLLPDLSLSLSISLSLSLSLSLCVSVCVCVCVCVCEIIRTAEVR